MKQIMLDMQSKGSYINTERLADSDIIIIIIISMNICLFLGINIQLTPDNSHPH